MIPLRSCVVCYMSKPWRDMVTFTKDKKVLDKWLTALTPNDDEKRILELRVEAAGDKQLYLCESHFDRNSDFELLSSGFVLNKNAIPVNVRNLFNDSSAQNAPSGSTSFHDQFFYTSQSPVNSRKRPATIKSSLEEHGIVPAKMAPPPANTVDITGVTTNGAVGATVKIEEIEEDDQLDTVVWVNSVIPLGDFPAEDLAELEAAKKKAEEENAPAVDTVTDCIDSVIRKSLEPPAAPQSDLLKPKLAMASLCYEAFEFIKENFAQTSLKHSDICHYISHKYRYYASGIMWKKQVFRTLNTSDHINVERLDKPENPEDDSLYTLNREQYDYRVGNDGELRVRWRKKNKNPVQVPNHSQVEQANGETQRRMMRQIPEASDDVALFNAIAGSLGVPPTLDE